MHASHFAAAALLVIHGFAVAQSGYAHGPGHCYHFQAPAGWLLDNRAAADQGVPMVFYPVGTTWQSAEVAMYTRPSALLRPGVAAVKSQVDEVVAMYRAASQTISAARIGLVQAKSGARGELWSFSGYRNGGNELAAYFVGRNTVNYFVAQVPRGASVEKAKQTLLELAATYREGEDCKPCGAGASCMQPN